MISAPQPARWHPILVRPDSSGHFQAQPIGAPELSQVADTAQDALAKAQQALAGWSGSLYWVLAPANGHALLDLAGHAKDDPDFELYLEEIARYRRELDERECFNTSSTPTT